MAEELEYDPSHISTHWDITYLLDNIALAYVLARGRIVGVGGRHGRYNSDGGPGRGGYRRRGCRRIVVPRFMLRVTVYTRTVDRCRSTAHFVWSVGTCQHKFYLWAFPTLSDSKSQNKTSNIIKVNTNLSDFVDTIKFFLQKTFIGINCNTVDCCGVY